ILLAPACEKKPDHSLTIKETDGDVTIETKDKDNENPTDDIKDAANKVEEGVKDAANDVEKGVKDIGNKIEGDDDKK
ncbi:MAG: hypothetical protein ABI743_09690, partial [bacterium]